MLVIAVIVVGLYFETRIGALSQHKNSLQQTLMIRNEQHRSLSKLQKTGLLGPLLSRKHLQRLIKTKAHEAVITISSLKCTSQQRAINITLKVSFWLEEDFWAFFKKIQEIAGFVGVEKCAIERWAINSLLKVPPLQGEIQAIWAVREVAHA